MTNTEILQYRLHNQQLIDPRFQKPAEIVEWLVAMQAQEYAMAKWAIGLRLPQAKDDQIEKAFNKGEILRTHLMRPTWHFVAPKDIRWMLALTAPRVHAINAYWYRKLELDKKAMSRILRVITKSLQGNQLTRQELTDELSRAKITGDGIRIGYMLMYAELEAIICSGPRKGKQFTYALMDERVAADQKKFKHEEALAALCSQYFISRAPATVQDFVTWSGLTVKDAKAGIEMIGNDVRKESYEGKAYFFSEKSSKIKSKVAFPTFLMPDYDEYGMSYKDRSALFLSDDDATFIKGGTQRDNNIVYNRMLIIDGQIAGTWKRSIEKNKIEVEVVPFAPLRKIKQEAVAKAIKRFQAFVGKSADE
jgi:hypothetical protein